MNARELAKEGPIKILRLPQVCDLTGLCRSMIYQMEADLRFPQRIKLGTRAVGWLEREVQEWLVNRIEGSRPQVIPPEETSRGARPAHRRRLGAPRGKR